MALEGKDINDSTILEATQRFQNPQGQIQFKIKLPSGRDVESEFFQPDMQKKAMVAWLDVVREQMVGDAEEVRAIARRAVAEQEAERKRQVKTNPASSIILTDSLDDARSVTSQASTDSLTTLAGQQALSTNAGQPLRPTADGTQTLSIDPVAYARSQLKQLKLEGQALSIQTLQLMQRQQQVEQQIQQWTAILSTMRTTSGVISNGSEPQSQAVPRRRGRPRKSDNRTLNTVTEAKDGAD